MVEVTILSIVRSAPTEAMILLSESTEVVDMSRGAKRLIDDFGDEDILRLVRTCTEGSCEEHILTQVKNVNSRQHFLEREKVGLRFTAHALTRLQGIASIVYIERLPSYAHLLEHNQMMEFVLETIPIGVCLHQLDPETGHTTHPVINKKMAELTGSDKEELRRKGTYIASGQMEDEEREYLESVVTDAYANLSHASFTVNTLRANGYYAPTKFTMQCYPGDDGKLQATAIGEEGIESDVEHVSVRRSARLMLSSFLSAVFDVSFYVNAKFQFIEDTPRVRYFFSADPTCRLVGRPLEVFMTLDEDKQRFREYMVRTLQQQIENLHFADDIPNYTKDPLFQSPSRLVHSVAPMIKLRLSTADSILSDCQLFVTPTYCGAPMTTPSSSSSGSLESVTSSTPITPTESSFNTNTTEAGGVDPMYLVGIRVLRTTGQGSQALPFATVEELRVPSYSTPLSRSSSHRPPPSTLSFIPEEKPASEAEPGTGMTVTDKTEPAPSVDTASSTSEQSHGSMRSVISMQLLRDSTGLLITSKLVRDITFCMNELVADDSDKRVRFDSQEVSSKDDWLVPVYEHYDYALTEQELLLLLPNNLQMDFINASRRMNYTEASHLLVFSTEGNIGVLQKVKGSTFSKNPYVLKLAFRYFFGMVFQLDGESTHQLLTLLQKQLGCIARRHLTRTEHRIVQLHLSLALIAAATRFPGNYTTNTTDMEWLRKSFITSLTLQTQCSSKVKSIIMPIVYFMCLLWAGLMKKVGRTDEALNLLANIYDDIRQFCNRHPYGILTRQVQACVCYNIAVTNLRRNQLDRAFHWLSILQNTLEIPYIEFPTPCYDVLEWAKYAQERAESM